MGTNKIHDKIAPITEGLAGMVQKAVARWTAKSPKVYQIITNIAIGTGLAASVITLIPVSYPGWVIPVTSVLIAIGSKFTVTKEQNALLSGKYKSNSSRSIHSKTR